MGTGTRRFRGKPIFVNGENPGYPAVSWDDHPVSVGKAVAYIHRVIAYEEFGEAVFDHHVHHKDGDTWNWSSDNLALVRADEHPSLHKKPPVKKKCRYCKVVFFDQPAGTRKYCSDPCYRKDYEKADWPENAALVEMINNSSIAAVARKLGVSWNAVKKRLRTRGLV